MATTKTLNTRIQLKYDSYENWVNNNPILLPGEIAICTIDSAVSGENAVHGNNVKQPTVLFKVGNANGAANNDDATRALSKFNALPWASGLAADVYGWAKAATKPKYTASEIEGLDEYIAGEIQDTDTDTRYSFEVTSEGKLKVTKTLYTLGVAGTPEEVGQYDFVTPEELENILKEYYTKTEVDAAIKAVDDKVKAIVIPDVVVDVDSDAGAEDTLEAVYGLSSEGHTISGTSTPTYSKIGADKAIAAALAEAKKYADDNDANDNTAHTHSVGAGLVKTGEGGVSGVVEYSANIDVVYQNSKIYLVDKTTKATIGEGFDASEFVKDSYLKSANYDADTNILTFTFVDNEDKLQAIPVDLTDLVDVYTADEVTLTKAGSQFSIKDNGISTNKIVDKAVTKAKLEDTVQASLDKADSAVQPAALENYQPKGDYQPAGNYKTVQTAVVDPTASGNALAFIDSISQNTNGEITATKKSIDLSNYLTKTSGIIEESYIANEAVTKAKIEKAFLEEIEGKANDADLAAIAKSGNVNDLVQGTNDVLVFNCGSASTVF